MKYQFKENTLVKVTTYADDYSWLVLHFADREPAIFLASENDEGQMFSTSATPPHFDSLKLELITQQEYDAALEQLKAANKSRIEKQERAQLAGLLKKYPDMKK